MNKHNIVDSWIEKNKQGVVISKSLCSCGSILSDDSVEMYSHLSKSEV